MRTRTLDNTTTASDPGGLALSHGKMREFHPELYEKLGLLSQFTRDAGKQKLLRIRHEEHLRFGDSRAALVVSVKPLLVADYTDELDCVAVLAFPQSLVSRYNLSVWYRLLTVNVYFRGDRIAPDLDVGPLAQGRWVNFTPLIADFLTDDLARLARRKSQISQNEWTRTAELATRYLERHPGLVRDGRPLFCGKPASVRMMNPILDNVTVQGNDTYADLHVRHEWIVEELEISVTDPGGMPMRIRLAPVMVDGSRLRMKGKSIQGDGDLYLYVRIEK